MVLKTVSAIEAGDYTETPQQETGDLKKAPKIFKETCKIEWDANAEDVYNFIRGLSPYPAAWTSVAGKNMKIFETDVLQNETSLKPGEFSTDKKSYLHVGTNSGALSILSLQAEGKRRMMIKDFLAGNASLFD